MTSSEGDVPSAGNSDESTSGGQPKESYWSGRLGQTPRRSASGEETPSPGVAAAASSRGGPPPAVPRDTATPPRQSPMATKKDRKRLAIVLVAVALVGGIAAAVVSTSTHNPASTNSGRSTTAASAIPLTWTKPTVIDPAMTNGSDFSVVSGGTDVSCPSTSFCLAFVGNDALTFDGQSWSTPRTLATTVTGKSISCATAASCVVTSGGFDSGGYYQYANGGWSGPTPVVINGEQVPGSVESSVDSLSCPTTSFCSGSTSSHGIVTFNGQDWAVTGSPAPTLEYLFNHVSSASANWCVAVGGNAVTTFDGHAWTTPQFIDPGMRGGDRAICGVMPDAQLLRRGR